MAFYATDEAPVVSNDTRTDEVLDTHTPPTLKTEHLEHSPTVESSLQPEGATIGESRLSNWEAPEAREHPQWEAIVRQVEYYFSDENLRQDKHLLGLAGEYGNGWVSLGEIFSWRKMRQYKPPRLARNALTKSRVLQLWPDPKESSKRLRYVRRIAPLTGPLFVTPEANSKSEQTQTLVEQPWMTKGMLKPTGFEANFADAPLTLEQHEAERKMYDPEDSFPVRIENAISRYQSGRKMHQQTLLVFTKFLMFGGFDSGPRQFGGKLSKKDLEDYDKDQIAQMMAQFSVCHAAHEGIDRDDGHNTWIVDFEAIAKAFFSSQFMSYFNWKDGKTVSDSTNILLNFYNYLLLHDVCPEYTDQIYRAQNVCRLANVEFEKLAKVDTGLPGDFNIAVSTLHGGMYATIRPVDLEADWVQEQDKTGLSERDAWTVFIAGIAAHCSEEQLSKVGAAAAEEKRLTATNENDDDEHMGLEVVRTEFATGLAQDVYQDSRLKNTFVKPTGKLHCIRWDLPHRPPQDLPKDVIAARKAKKGENIEFIMEEETLRHCYPGLKIEATVRKLEIDIKWIDSFDYVYPSFFTWTLNESVRDWKEPGPPKAWQQRQALKKAGGVNESGEVPMENDGDENDGGPISDDSG